jgi:hypothetical protein
VARTLPFIVFASLILLAPVAALLAGLSLSTAFVLCVGAYLLFLASPVIVGPWLDRRAPAFREHPDGLMREMASADLESEILDADCGYHVHLGANTHEQTWAVSPLAEDHIDPGVDFPHPEDWLAELAPRLLNEAGVAHRYEERGNLARVVIPRIRHSGFDVTVEAATFGVLVRTGTLFHAHFPFSPYEWDWHEDDGDENEGEEFRDPFDPDTSRTPVEQALGLVRDLLSPAVRIRERRAAGISYHAALEVHVAGRWRRRRAVTLLCYPYWGRREERLLANTHLGTRIAD